MYRKLQWKPAERWDRRAINPGGRCSSVVGSGGVRKIGGVSDGICDVQKSAAVVAL